MEQIRLMNGLGSLPGRPGREVPARMPPAPRPGVRKTWEDVIFQQLEGHFCAIMGWSGGGRAGNGTGQAGEPHAGRVGGQGQAREAGRVPRPDGLRRALGGPAGPGRAAKDGRGRQPWPAETLPGTRPVRCWPDLPGVACEAPATTRSWSATSWGAGTACPTPRPWRRPARPRTRRARAIVLD